MLHHLLRDPNKAQLSFHIHNHLLAISFSGRSGSNTGNFRFSSCIQKAGIQVQLYHDEVREAREVSFELSLDQVSEGLQILLTLFLNLKILDQYTVVSHLPPVESLTETSTRFLTKSSINSSTGS
ncbi:uncharacterized protein EV154DRAFT_486383 [Mucor mucedo]|uniref:uncharacterized protein n=1 Tax=Mucor mucedo TaxID=29922 RepID=UPI0022207847|nr:uncharacterized protein EV154DRAFT_486383 [Mucor mucedo]KAI7877096.1 hypothetical protein EV154DRAFT_486383 [Mucor mucedo]